MPSRPPRANNKRKNVALYPSAQIGAPLSREALELKIARHSRCTLCLNCNGLSPEDNLNVMIDSEWDGVSSGAAYIKACRCGHEVGEHGVHKDITPEEFQRRGRIAVRLDELLEDENKLLDFTYENHNIISLRKQIRLPELTLSPLSDGSHTPAGSGSRKHDRSSSSMSPPPPNKKRRLSANGEVLGLTDYSSSPLSNADEVETEANEGEPAGNQTQTQPQIPQQLLDDSDSDEEDQPLALLNAQKPLVPPRYGGKAASGHMTVVGSVPVPSTTQPVIKNAESLASKSKGKIGGEKLQRLTTGVTVDTEGDYIQPHNKPLKPAQLELQAGLLKIISVPPYPVSPTPQTKVLLTNVKCLIQKLLPMMPREYITRLVFDKNSHTMAIVKRGLKVVGGICFRVFEQRGFAEIVFFATDGSYQDRGYGSMLMNHFKMHIKKTYPDMIYFLTYADNNAVDYFKKQGFSKEITLDRSVWAGYIKDYEGGTIMQCTMLDKVNYLDTRDIILKQREAILTKIRQISRSDTVHPPLPQFLNAKEDEKVEVDWQTVPGLRESGWTPSMVETPQPASKNPQHSAMVRWLSELQGHSAARPFLQPVNRDEVVDYYDVIKSPMDFSTMEHKLEHNMYASIDSFIADANLVFDNCLLYNPEGSFYAKTAIKLSKFLKAIVAQDMKKMKVE